MSAWPRSHPRARNAVQGQGIIEQLVNERGTTPNQRLVELVVETLDRREWLRTALGIQMLRSCLFAAQAAPRDMSAAGCGEEVEAVRCAISKIIPKLHNESSDSSETRSEAAFILNGEKAVNYPTLHCLCCRNPRK